MVQVHLIYVSHYLSMMRQGASVPWESFQIDKALYKLAIYELASLYSALSTS